MAAVGIRQITRPSLDSQFPFEVRENAGRNWDPLYIDISSSNNALSSSARARFPGLTSIRLVEAITWTEVNARKAELRADIKAVIDQPDSEDPSDTYINLRINNPDLYGTGPYFNPFSLTWTIETTCTDLDTLKALYELDTIEHAGFAEALTHTGNTITERAEVDGVEVSDFPFKSF